MKPKIFVLIISVLIASVIFVKAPQAHASFNPVTAPSQKYEVAGSNGCELSPYAISAYEARIYIDKCNMDWMIALFNQVGSAWSTIYGQLPHPIAKVISKMGGAQKVLAFILTQVNNRCGSQGVTIYKKSWFPLPWYECGRRGV